MWPALGTITSRFGWRTHPLTKRREFHKALDIANNKGTPIRATADGKAIFVGWQGSYGKSIIIDHGHSFSTHYSHNNTLLIKAGERVKRGQIIALLGSTGRSTGPHIHYEVWYKGKPVNPIKYVTKK
jgi:murein DD-endopeptidase MepM/ murein hydrolase activator NlpD